VQVELAAPLAILIKGKAVAAEVMAVYRHLAAPEVEAHMEAGLAEPKIVEDLMITAIIVAQALFASSGPETLVNSHQLRWDHHNKPYSLLT
jgi:hypothetical protein